MGMVIFWTLVTVLPVLAFGGGALFFRAGTRALAERFFASRKAAFALTLVAWLWTAFECATIGVDVFDAILLKEPTHGAFVWALALVLVFLTCLWMPQNLSCRALMGLFMLMPAEALKTTRLLVPAEGFAPVQLLVALIYLYAVVGMYGMFYPWRIEKAVRWLLKERT